ncbi:DUF2513 domain-containing protein [Paenibacillus caseinilyticus]|uniref:DUF2513 domain-containing protein n=1 Tax=Paenibacillus mucilaginosus K02 TaxID=997761 RepID=I0BIV4_9BACL|nr:DUF2513 domain-containing protein [Paenibacillus mucilaginosus]AFH62301.1 hypothetical protein B2K_16495 [Paenibacillus mucilaginosus K02]
MKRDMDLIIQILKVIEEYKTPTNNIVVQLDGYEDEEKDEIVQGHCVLLRDAGFIEGKVGYQPYTFTVTHMTWEGHEFLDLARNDTVVEKAKSVAKQKGLEFSSLPLDIAKDFLSSTFKSMIGL